MDAVIPNNNNSITADGMGDAPRKPLVNSFQGYISYSMSFFFTILCWFVAGAGLYDLLSRVSAMYSLVYILWAIPLLGLFACIFTGTTTVYWSGTIIGWTWVIVIIQAFRTLFYGFALETSPLRAFYPVTE
jgi:hypothetical protein